MTNQIHYAWTEANAEDRFAFLVLLDQMYGEGKKQRGRGLQLIHQSFLAKIKRVEEEGQAVGNVKFGNPAA